MWNSPCLLRHASSFGHCMSTTHKAGEGCGGMCTECVPDHRALLGGECAGDLVRDATADGGPAVPQPCLAKRAGGPQDARMCMLHRFVHEVAVRLLHRLYGMCVSASAVTAVGRQQKKFCPARSLKKPQEEMPRKISMCWQKPLDFGLKSDFWHPSTRQHTKKNVFLTFEFLTPFDAQIDGWPALRPKSGPSGDRRKKIPFLEDRLVCLQIHLCAFCMDPSTWELQINTMMKYET